MGFFPALVILCFYNKVPISPQHVWLPGTYSHIHRAAHRPGRVPQHLVVTQEVHERRLSDTCKGTQRTTPVSRATARQRGPEKRFAANARDPTAGSRGHPSFQAAAHCACAPATGRGHGRGGGAPAPRCARAHRAEGGEGGTHSPESPNTSTLTLSRAAILAYLATTPARTAFSRCAQAIRWLLERAARRSLPIGTAPTWAGPSGALRGRDWLARTSGRLSDASVAQW